MMEVEEEFAPTSRPTLRYTEPELAEQTQVPCKVRVATDVPKLRLCGNRTTGRQRNSRSVKSWTGQLADYTTRRNV